MALQLELLTALMLRNLLTTLFLDRTHSYLLPVVMVTPLRTLPKQRD